MSIASTIGGLPFAQSRDRVVRGALAALPARRGRFSAPIVCSISSGTLGVVTRGVALKSGLAKGPWPALLHLAAGELSPVLRSCIDRPGSCGSTPPAALVDAAACGGAGGQRTRCIFLYSASCCLAAWLRCRCPHLLPMAFLGLPSQHGRAPECRHQLRVHYCRRSCPAAAPPSVLCLSHRPPYSFKGLPSSHPVARSLGHDGPLGNAAPGAWAAAQRGRLDDHGLTLHPGSQYE